MEDQRSSVAAQETMDSKCTPISLDLSRISSKVIQLASPSHLHHLLWLSLVLHDLSQLLNTGLSREQLRACVELIESGVNAEAVAVSDH